MAIAQNNTVTQADISSIYTSFNNFITNYGGSIAKLTAPGQHTVVYASQFNALNNKINEFKNDTYLKTQTGWWVAGPTVTAGASKLEASNFTNINTTIGNFSKVKCRNNTYRSHNNRSHSNNNNGNNGNGKCTSNTQNNHDYNGNGACDHWLDRNFNGNGANGQNGNSPKANGACGANGYKDHSTHSHTACTSNGACSSNGTCKNTTYIDITKAHTNA